MSDGEINVDSIDGEVSTSANIVGQLYPQGEKGDKGDPGNDGFSPTVTTEKVGKTTTITITDAEGEHTATILDGQDGQGSGDMLTSVYDTDHNGIVDNAEKVNNHTVGTDVPADAVFTDTTYTAGTGIDITGNVITNTQTSAEWGNITGTLSDQTDLKNALDDKANTSSLSSVATSGNYSDLLNKPSIPTNTSDLTNNSGFIDKDVNNLTNYDTSTTVDTKISNSEEVLIGSDSGIKASHELWVDTNDVTPYINSEISNDYGTAQNLGYSQAYSNTTFATKDVATTSANGLMSASDKSNLDNLSTYTDVPITLDSNFTATRLFCRKYGKVVHLHFHGYAKTDDNDFYTILNGLPKVYLAGDYPVIGWAQGTTPNAVPTGTRYLWINTSGELQGYGITKNQYTLVHITYITTD